MADPAIYPSQTFSRPTWAEINLTALSDNALVLLGACKADGRQPSLIAVIKANAYGHGAVQCARALLQSGVAKMLAVASVDEAESLREAGVTAPILLLSAILPEEAEAVVTHGLIPTVYTSEVAAALDKAAQKQKKTASLHWKIDTGMGRVGVGFEEAARVWRELNSYSHLKIEGIYTHFACADEPDDNLTPRQLARFESVLAECGISKDTYLLHAANSAGTLRYPEAGYDAVRCGIALYGASPFGVEKPSDLAFQLQPAMSLKSRVTDIRKIKSGETVSYGATWTASRDSLLALVPIGYADGYPRVLSNRGEVLLRGQRCRVAGRVTMDQILVDVTDISPVAALGEIVTVWGKDEQGSVLLVEEVAAKAGTISYELLTAVAPRVPRIYLN